MSKGDISRADKFVQFVAQFLATIPFLASRLKPPNSASQEGSCGFKSHPGTPWAKCSCPGCGPGAERPLQSGIAAFSVQLSSICCLEFKGFHCLICTNIFLVLRL